MDRLLVLLCVMASGWAQDTTDVPETTEASTTTTTTQVPILRQINQVNEDGTYPYGFEAADGTFKIETRDLEGNVKGKYGYVDEFGELKIVEYVAGNVTGFEATSDLLPKQVPVPEVPQQLPSIPNLPRPQFNPQATPQFAPRPQPQPQPQFAPRPQPQPQPQFTPRPQPQ